MLIGCGRNQPPAPKEEMPVIPIARPVQRKISDYVEYTGRTVAVNSVDVRARVTGYLVQMPFEEGSEVRKGDLLFEIDPAPYKAMVEQAQAQLVLNQASFKLAETTYARDRSVAGKATGAVSQQQLDQDRAAVDEAQARIKASQASLDYYKLNLSYTRVLSPIDGMVSRYYLTLGNLVNQDQTLLTTVVSLDPIYAYFDVDQLTIERVRDLINRGTIPMQRRADIPVFLGLQAEGDRFPHEGKLDFVNNQLNPSTGTLAARAKFDNPRPENGVRLMSPGMFVRIKVPIGPPHDAKLVIDRAIGSDQGRKFVYVVDQDNIVQYRPVTTGSLQEDGLRVIVSGLEDSDWVVVGGLPLVRSKMQVKTQEIEMPTLASPPPPGLDRKRPQPPPPGLEQNRPQPPPPGQENKQ
jgi:multidrug efflux system membrane fusion protein